MNKQEINSVTPLLLTAVINKKDKSFSAHHFQRSCRPPPSIGFLEKKRKKAHEILDFNNRMNFNEKFDKIKNYHSMLRMLR